MHFREIGLMLLLVATNTINALAIDWRQFRGPNSNGTILDANFPETWGVDSNINWKVSVPGEGWSSPIVVGQKVFVTTAVSSGQKNKNSEHVWKVLCLDATTGETRWSKDAIKSQPKLGTHRDNTYASETPATDGHMIVAYFGMMGVFCYDLDGNEIWKKDLGNFQMRNDWGTSSSPIIHNGLAYCPDEKGNTFVIKPGPKLDLVRVNKIPEDNSRFWASSAGGSNTLFVRSSKTIYAVSTN